MRAWLVIGLAGCYAPDPISGAPCSDLRHCPAGQHCVLVDGVDRCVTSDPARDALVVGSEAPPAAPWSLVQTRGASSDHVNIPETGTGHLIVVAIETNDKAVIGVSDDAGNGYLPIAGSRGVDVLEKLGVELWYAKSSVAGATRITAAGPQIYGMAMWEVAGIASGTPLGPVSKLDDQPASTTPAGAPITTPAPGMFVVSIGIVANSVTGLVPDTGFKNDHTVLGNGWAHLADPAAPPGTYQARWNQPNDGESCASSAAFFAGS